MSGSASTGRINKTSKRKKTRNAGANAMSRSGKSSSTNRNINALFDKFKDVDSNADKIGPEGLEALFQALSLNPVTVEALIFAWKMNGEVPFEFTRAQFTGGCLSLGCDTLEKLKRAIPKLKNYLADAAEFRKFFMFAFDYNIPPGTKSLPLDTAIPLYPLILEGRFRHLDLWVEFLEGRGNQMISRDTHSMLHEFVTTITADLGNFDEDGAWPVLLDEFVEFARPKLGLAANTSELDEESDDSS